MGLRVGGGVRRRKRRRMRKGRNFCICESIGHRLLWGPLPKRRGPMLGRMRGEVVGGRFGKDGW